MGNKNSRSRRNNYNGGGYYNQAPPQQQQYQRPSAPPVQARSVEPEGFKMIPDRFETLPQVQKALQKAGLESSDLIIGVDFTKSNTWKGKQCFGEKSLHDISDPTVLNPYMQAIDVIGKTLKPFDDDGLIPVWGFGDGNTRSSGVFPFKSGDNMCYGFEEVFSRYKDVLRDVRLSGPTSFAPIIDKAIDTVIREKSYHILVILTDGDVSEECKQATINSIVKATEYPISIVVIGLGDGPFDLMDRFDDELPERKFDNFQFVNFEFVKKNAVNFEAEFAVWALMEIPDQYLFIKKNGLISRIKN